MFKHVVMLLLLLLLLAASSCRARDRNLLFYQTKPTFRPAVLQVQGYVEDSDSERLELPYQLLDLHSDGVKLEIHQDNSQQQQQQQQPGEQILTSKSTLATSGNYGVQQRFLGGLFNIFPVARTQTVIQVATRTSVVVPLCVLCTTTAAGNAPAVCAPPGAPLPTTCPIQNRRKRQSFQDFIQPSRIRLADMRPNISFFKLPLDGAVFKTTLYNLHDNLTRNPELNPSSDTFQPRNEFLTPLVILSSMEDEPRDLEQRESYQFISTSLVTTTVTVTGTVTAQVQVGNLNCLPQYLATVPKCTLVGI